jgi:hypothetical protein
MAAFRGDGVSCAFLDALASVERSLGWHKCSADLRRLLSHIDRSELISLFHASGASEMHSVGRLRFLVMLFLAVFLVLSFFLAYQALVVGAWDLFLSLAVAASVGAAIYMGALLRVKLRSPEPISDA